MMAQGHTSILQRAAALAGGFYGQVVLSQQRWLECCAAGRFNDGVLRDWLYTKPPQAVWCSRRLTRAVLALSPEEIDQVAFLLHWVSHYFVDSLWTAHVAGRFLGEVPHAERKLFDNSIEREAESVVEELPVDLPAGWGELSYWAAFWHGYRAAELRAPALIEAYRQGAGYLLIALESVPHSIWAIAAYLRYLNRCLETAPATRVTRVEQGMAAEGAHARLQPPIQVTWSGTTVHRHNAWVIALHVALEQARPLHTILSNGSSWHDTGAPENASANSEVAPTGDIRLVFPHGEQMSVVPACPPAEAGWRTDDWLDAIRAGFGSGPPQLAAWPGEWVLTRGLARGAVYEQVFSESFAADLAVVRGYATNEIVSAPDQAAPQARADRERQLAAEAAWLARWHQAWDPAQRPEM
jgi:hypothetical protein